MNVGLTEAHLNHIEQEWDKCRNQPERFDVSQYWLCNEAEFWAELTQANSCFVFFLSFFFLSL